MKDEQAIREFMLISEGFGRPDAVTALKWVLGEWPTPEPAPCVSCELLKTAIENSENTIRILQDANRRRQQIIADLQIKLKEAQP